MWKHRADNDCECSVKYSEKNRPILIFILIYMGRKRAEKTPKINNIKHMQLNK